MTPGWRAGGLGGRAGGHVFRAAVALLSLASPAPACLHAQTTPENSGALFLLFPLGARAVGMGQTAAALDDRGEMVFWNPAGVAGLSGNEAAVHVANFAAGTTTALTGFFTPGRFGTVGASVELVDYGSQDVNDSTGSTLARISPRNLAFLATYAVPLPGGLAIGLSYKLIEFRVDCSGDCTQVPAAEGTTHALDLGGQWRSGPDGAVRIAMVVRNLGFPLQVNNRDQADPLPTRVVLGALYTVALRPVGGIEGAGRFDIKVAADVDSRWGATGDPEMRVGVDVGYLHYVRVRGGYAFVHEGMQGPSVGLGLATGSIGIDLARMFLTGTDLIADSPTFVSFRATF